MSSSITAMKPPVHSAAFPSAVPHGHRSSSSSSSSNSAAPPPPPPSSSAVLLSARGVSTATGRVAVTSPNRPPVRGGQGHQRAGTTTGPSSASSSSSSTAHATGHTSSSSSFSSSHLSLPPRPSSSSPSLSGSSSSSTARRVVPPPSVPRVSLADRGVLRDVGYISDWLISVEQSNNISAFASLIAKVKRTIFTPEQVKRTKQQQRGSGSISTPSTRQSTVVVSGNRAPLRKGSGVGGGNRTGKVDSGQEQKMQTHETQVKTSSHSPFLPHSTTTNSTSSTSSRPTVLLSLNGAPSSTSSSPSSSSSPSQSNSPRSLHHRSRGEGVRSVAGEDEDGGGDGESEMSGIEGVDDEEDDDFAGLMDLEEKVSQFAVATERSIREGRDNERTTMGGRAHRATSSIAPVGVEFVQGRWVPVSPSPSPSSRPFVSVQTNGGEEENRAATSPHSTSSSVSSSSLVQSGGGSGGADGLMTQDEMRGMSPSSSSQLSIHAGTAALTSSSASSFPVDLDDLPDWDEGTTGSRSQLTGEGELDRPSSASISTSTHLAPSSPSDSFDELDAIPDFDEEPLTTQHNPLSTTQQRHQPLVDPAHPITSLTSSSSSSSSFSSSTSCSPLLAAKMAQFPDDMTVRELEELDDDGGAGTLDDDTSTSTSTTATTHRDAAAAPPTSSSSSTSSGLVTIGPSSVSRSVLPVGRPVGPATVASRLHDRLLRVSMGGRDHFPEDIDSLDNDDNDDAGGEGQAGGGGQHPSSSSSSSSSSVNLTPSSSSSAPSLNGTSSASTSRQATSSPSSSLSSSTASPTPTTATTPAVYPATSSPTGSLSSPASSPSSSSSTSSSLLPCAPSSRVLNEFVLSPSLVSSFQAMEADHRPVDTVQVPPTNVNDGDEEVDPLSSSPPLSRSLQLTWIIQQAERFMAATQPHHHTTTTTTNSHRSPHPQPQPPIVESRRSKLNGSTTTTSPAHPAPSSLPHFRSSPSTSSSSTSRRREG